MESYHRRDAGPGRRRLRRRHRAGPRPRRAGRRSARPLRAAAGEPHARLAASSSVQDGERSVALLVDSAREVVKLEPEQLEPPPRDGRRRGRGSSRRCAQSASGWSCSSISRRSSARSCMATNGSSTSERSERAWSTTHALRESAAQRRGHRARSRSGSHRGPSRPPASSRRGALERRRRHRGDALAARRRWRASRQRVTRWRER